MKAYSTQQVKQAENEIIQSGISEEELIDRASDHIVTALKAHEGTKAFLVGGGNNGSDALACSLKIKEKIKIYITDGKRNSINESLLQKVRLVHEVLPLKSFDGKCDVILDGLFGTGLSREISEEICATIKIANESKAYRIAIDIPSGLNDCGIACPIAFCADEVVVLGALKEANILNDAPDYTKKLTVCDIGLKLEGGADVLDKSAIKIPKRKRNTHKGDYGKVKIVGGSEKFVSAPLFSAISSLKSGAGITTLTIPNSLKYFYSLSSHYGYTLDFLPENDTGVTFCENSAQEIMKNATTIVIGMGMGNNEQTKKYVEYFINNFEGTLVIDADGINAISSDISLLKNTNRKAKIILTPHIGEYKRLNPSFDKKPSTIKTWAKENDVVIAVKSSATIISNGERLSINTVGTPALAKGGSGDILAGVVGALSCVMDRYSAVESACVILGLAGTIASKKVGNETSVIPLDVINSIPDAINEIQ